MWAVNWDGEFVVGGEDNLRLTPAFRVKEFRDAGGAVRVHRELVSALQLMRDTLGRPLSIKRVVSNGRGAVVSCDRPDDLRAAARGLCDRGVFVTFEPVSDGVHVEIPDSSLPPVGLDQALETAFSVTAAFETAGDRFQQITGNFDGAGLSFGPAQVNFKSETLQPLFAKFKAADEAALKACFPDIDDYNDFQRILASPIAAQLAWATSVSTGRGNHDVVEPWADAESRPVGILAGTPVSVGDRQRANINFYLLRNVSVDGVDRLVKGDMTADVERVRTVLAQGDTLLA